MSATESNGVELQAAARRALTSGVPQSVIDEACRATRRVLSRQRVVPSGRRLVAYFEACVRRQLVRRHGGSVAAARVVAEAVVADLFDGGRSKAAVADELERGWSSYLPPEVLQEFRTRLCA